MTNTKIFQGMARLLALATLVMMPPHVLAADGKALFSTCGACHGPGGEGNIMIGAPNIAGMAAWYSARQLANFSSGKRGSDKADAFGAQMRAAAMVVNSDEQREAVAKYVASLPSRAVTAAAAGNPADLANGRNQFNVRRVVETDDGHLGDAVAVGTAEVRS